MLESKNFEQICKRYKGIYEKFLNFLEKEEDIELNFQNIKLLFEDEKKTYYQQELRLFFHLLLKVSNEHHRGPNFFSKIEQILRFFRDNIKKYFPNSEIFNLFKKNKRILLFLIEEKILIADEYFAKQITKEKYLNEQYPQYFAPEIKKFADDEWFLRLDNNLAEKIKKKLPEDFNELRKKGENDSFICKLIREDLVDDFIAHLNKYSISRNATINPSIYETNSFINKMHIQSKKSVTLIEYAAFFGSIQIFTFLKNEGVELTPSLWFYAIHSKNTELIHLLEEIFIKLPALKFHKTVVETSYKEYFNESIKCHHNDFAKYFLDNYLQNKDENSNEAFIQSLKNYNFSFIQNKHINVSSFFFLFQYDYYSPANFIKTKLKNIVQKYCFFNISDVPTLQKKDKYFFNQNIKQSKVIIVNKMEEKQDDEIMLRYLIICFEKTIIIHECCSFTTEFLQYLFSINPRISICFLHETKTLINNIDKIQNPEIKADEIFYEEINKLNKDFRYKKSDFQIWKSVLPCISGYLIKKSYLQLNKNRIHEFNLNSEEETKPELISESDYIELRRIGQGSSFICTLIYYIKKGELCVIKKPNANNNEYMKLTEREADNYTKIRHPFIPRYYGRVKNINEYYIVIEYINGQTLNNINKMELTFDEKIEIIYELMIVLKYIHDNNMVYRDLKPTNVIIDENKTAVLIDFDRLIEIESSDEKTMDLGTEFQLTENYTYKNDIYSLGKMIEYIMNNGKLNNNAHKKIKLHEYLQLDEIIQNCSNKSDGKLQLISAIFHYYLFSTNQNIPEAQFNLGVIHFEGKYVTFNIDKAIHYYSLAANQNDRDAQFNLGVIYSEGKYVTRDINKAIHYYSLAANQNLPQAQFNLGNVYSKGKYVTRDINKAIHYYSLAANQNFPQAQYNLGLIYSEGKYVTRDINKAIHYFSLAANQNHPQAQYNLGVIYYESKYATRDIDKAIHYLTLAANQNYSQAQYNLGFIYSEDEYVKHDINKAIHYLTLAANQNNPLAQCKLGLIYHEGKYVTRDINKAIHYYSLAANQNLPGAQFNLGLIYDDDKYATHDINKAIHYYSLAANQNFPEAQFNLGNVYSKGKYVTRDINKAIHYYSLAANQNDRDAQFKLGVIYSEGKYVTRDINKAIHYLSLAANQNLPQAQFNLGLIYHEGKYVTRDIDKAIHYYSLAANQNIPEAQFNLGNVYSKGEYVTRNINKAIHYFSLAANQNIIQASIMLGSIYSIGNGVAVDFNKAIHYFTLAANQNHSEAQYLLGIIYYQGSIVTRDIKKAIYYFLLASNQNISEAQNILGGIYYIGEYVTRNINKAIHYFTLAANQNHSKAQFNLGLIYSKGKYVTRDINKAIHYFVLAANQNDPQAQCNLGLIYSDGKYVTRDIYRAIHYYSLAANQNHSKAQCNLGLIYSKGKYVTRDINKAIHYFSLAANQNDPEAQFNLGFIYYEGKYVIRDINKAIHYYSLAANQNDPQAQFNLGFIYDEGEYVTHDINKAIHYLSLAANQNHPQAQLILGNIYYTDTSLNDIKKGRYYIMLASKNGDRYANFSHGFLLHEGKIIEKNIEEAIHYYKEASSFNIQYAKNNLGIIYKHGYGNIKGHLGNAIVYFEEAIRQKEDYLSMYNLAHIYMFSDQIKFDRNILIELLIKSSSKFNASFDLLCLALIKYNGFNIKNIKKEIIQKNVSGTLLDIIIDMVIFIISFGKSFFEYLYTSYSVKDFVYNNIYEPILTSDLENTDEEIATKYPNAKEITPVFYEGFGLD